MQNEITPYRFFAAANGANGFRSYFDDIFPLESLDKLYILKGGPGTGKSTLLRNIASHFNNEIIHTEIFFCSSDPKSLDGVLLAHGNKSVAIIDGTAPHERDARIPGATDMLINLADAFEENVLKQKKNDILHLQKGKQLAYKDAYFYLTIFGIFGSKVLAETKQRLREDALNSWIYKNIPSKADNKKPSLRLISSFSKDGLKTLPTFENLAKKHIRIYGSNEENAVFLSSVFSQQKELLADFIYSPSPLFSDIIDGLYFNPFALSITVTDRESDADLLSSDFFSKQNEAEKARCDQFKEECLRYLSLAKVALKKASDFHFELESIYTPCVNFLHIKEIKNDLISKITEELCLTEIS